MFLLGAPPSAYRVELYSPLGPMSLFFGADPTSLGFAGALSFITATCHGLRSRYVWGEAPRRLYMAVYGGFYLSMLGIIFSLDLLSLFIFWDGLGITSFFLVALFGGTIPRAGGRLTVLTNRAGDIMLLVGMAGVWGGGTRLAWELDFGGIISGLAPRLICLGLFCKRAQWPFCGWLPAAMSAPTPVSALVHSSTLVTAGIYILLRWPVLTTPG